VVTVWTHRKMFPHSHFPRIPGGKSFPEIWISEMKAYLEKYDHFCS
jgi:hypothetical protein